MNTRSAVLRAALLAAAASGCTQQGEDLPAGMTHSFVVTLSAKNTLATGTEAKPVDYVSGTSCATNPCPGSEECIGYCSPTGEACAVDQDCPTGTYCAKVCAKPAVIDIQALGRDGKPTDDEKETWVHLRMVPGFIPPPYEYALLKKGKAGGVQVYLSQAVGESYVWVEDLGTGPSSQDYGECNNDKDEDGDGFVDVADPDCVDPLDPEEDPPTFATGLSPAFFFETPTLWHIQYTDQVSTSPLDGHDIYVDKGQLVITNVIANGFYITDVSGQKPIRDDGSPGYFNSFFLYTFSKPEEVFYGDILCNFSGGVVEYEGNTQMTYPTYDVYRSDYKDWGLAAPCELRTDLKPGLEIPVPDPVDVTDLISEENPKSPDYSAQQMATAQALEPFESSLVTLRDVNLSVRFLACDSDEDDSYPSGSDDDLCRDTCQADPYCTQLESYFEYSQVAAYANSRKKKLFVGLDMMKDNVPLEVAYIGSKDVSGNCPSITDPDTGEVLVQNPHKVTIGDTLYTEYTCPESKLDSVTGNLRHIYLCPPKPGKKESCGLQLTMLIPRSVDDLVFTRK